MKKYQKFAFILGRNIKISLTEIAYYLEDLEIQYEIDYFKEPILMITIKSKFNTKKIAKELAGTLKIVRIYLETNDQTLREDLDNSNFYIEDSRKIEYSFDYYGASINQNFFQSYFKNKFKELRQKALIKKLPPNALSRALDTRTFLDIIVIKFKNVYQIGLTVGAYDISDNKKRYEKRPNVEEIIGTSIRIARILVNLSGLNKKPQAELYDPFCGIGTILQEGLLKNLNVYGSDIEKKRINQSKENLNWLKNNYKITSKYNLKIGKAENLDKTFPETNFDAIVTEPELGPFLSKLPSKKEADNYIGELMKIYMPVFKKASKILTKGNRFVIILPNYITSSGKSITLDINTLISNTELILHQITKKDAEKMLKISNPITYAEKWHKIERLIYILERK